jgi:hypothetical protein
VLGNDRACTPVPPLNFHGKEGVDGSSPSEGLYKNPANGHVVLPALARFRFFAGTRQVHFGTGGHLRAHATSRGTSSGAVAMLDRDHPQENPCKQAVGVARAGAMLTPSFARRWSDRCSSSQPPSNLAWHWRTCLFAGSSPSSLG